MDAMPPRTTDQLIAQAHEIGDQTDDVDEHLRQVRKVFIRYALAAQNLREVITDARLNGATWADIGKVVGTTGEGARRKYGWK